MSETQAPAEAKQPAQAAEPAATVQKKPKPAAKPASKKREEKVVYSRPVFAQKTTIYTLQAQRVVDRSLVRASYSLFSLDVILQVIGDRDQIDEVSDVVHGHISKASQDMQEKLTQMKALLEQHQITEQPTYTNPRELEVEITSPQVAQFLRLITQLDSLMAMIDTLWFHGVLSSKQRTQAGLEWQQHLNRLASRIIGVEKRARIAANKQGKRDEVEAKAPVRKDEEAIDDSTDDAGGEKVTEEEAPSTEARIAEAS